MRNIAIASQSHWGLLELPEVNETLCYSITLPCFPLQASMVKLPEDEDTPEKRVNRIFNQMDTVITHYCTSQISNSQQ